MRVGIKVAAVAMAGLAAVSGCSSTSGQKPGSSGVTPSAMASSVAPQPTVGSTVPAAELGARMSRAIVAQGTVHELIATSRGNFDAYFDLSASPPAARIVGTTGDFRADTRVVGGTVYMQSDEIAVKLPGNKTWLAYEPDSKKQENRAVLWALSLAAPLGVVGPLLVPLGDAPVTVVSSKPGLTGYEMSISREQYGAALKALGADPEMTDLAVGALPSGQRKLSFSVDDRDLPVTASGLSDPSEGTFDRWGEPVTIERPPASVTQAAE